MLNRVDALRLWRRLTASRAAVAVALVALLVISVFGAGAFLARASESAPAHAHAHAPKPNPKDEGQWFQQSHFGTSQPAPDALAKARAQAAKLPRSPLGSTARPAPAGKGTSSPALVTNPATWTPLGPQAIDTSVCATTLNCTNYGVGSGRVTALAVDPSNGQDVWAGAADGGVWHSTDGGAHWTPITDSQATLSMGSIVIDGTTTPHTIYVGTGEANFNGDAYPGTGILKIQVNSGTPTITPLASSSFAGLSIGKLAVLDPDPNNANQATLLAAVSFDGIAIPPGGQSYLGNTGVWRSTDGGTTWSQVLRDASMVGACGCFRPDFGTDVIFDAAHPGVAYAALSDTFGVTASGFTPAADVYVSVTSGASWSALTGGNNGFHQNANTGRITLGLSATGTTLWALDASVNGAASLYTTAITINALPPYNPTAVWGNVSLPSAMSTDDNEFQWWYDAFVAFDPTVSAGPTVYIGGVDIWKTPDGGGSWANVTDVYGTNPVHVHPDEHALAFLPGTSSFYIGNDGGVWSGTNTSTFANLNSGLNITQFYGGSFGDWGGSLQLYGGTQDNGTVQYPGASVSGTVQWNQVLGGDGGSTVVDYNNNAIVFAENPFGKLWRSTDAGANWAPADYNHDGKGFPGSVNFVMPVVESPYTNDPDMMLAATDRVFRTTSASTADSWSAISPVLDSYACGTSTCTAPISALAISPLNDQFMYAGDDLGHVFTTFDGGADWFTNPSFFCPDSMVTSLAIDPNDYNTAYATCAGFTAGGRHIYKTTDEARHWIDISATLPDVPFESILATPKFGGNLLIAGSDAGVFDSPDGGTTWYQLGTGLPNVAINQVFMNHSGDERLFVATHGRGMWELDFPFLEVSPSFFTLTTSPGVSPGPEQLHLSNESFGTLNWTAGPLPSWVSLSQTSGTLTPNGGQVLTLTFAIPPTDPAKTYSTTLTINAPTFDNTPISVPITVIAANVSKQWYFAEGTTAGRFQTYLSISNPNNTLANVHIQYYLDTGANASISKDYTIGPYSRITPNVNGDIGAGHAVSMTVTSDIGVVAERPMYFNFRGIPGGTDVLGATSLSSNFSFGYVDTTTNHTTFFTILNPDPSNAMDAQLTLYPAAGGSSITFTKTIAAASRGTIGVNTEVPNLPAGTYSATLSLVQHGTTTPMNGLVERPMYLIDGTTGYTGSADVIGVSGTQTSWNFAEGATGSTFFERYILSNPCLPAAAGGCNSTPHATATVTFYRPSGSPVQATVSLTAGQQKVVNVNTLLGQGVSNSATVSSDHPILAERFMSFSYHGIPGATDVLGAASTGYRFDFAEGVTSSDFTEFLTIENPNAQAAIVTVSILPAGPLPQCSGLCTQVYTVAANSRFTLKTNDIITGSFSLEVESSQPIVAERPMYFRYHGSDTGGTDIIGYQP
jgi:photosystem II stability/assembly factor-like uncharacterized protein